MYLFFMKMPCQEMLMLLLMLKLVFRKVLVIAKLQLGYNLTKKTLTDWNCLVTAWCYLFLTCCSCLSV